MKSSLDFSPAPGIWLLSISVLFMFAAAWFFWPSPEIAFSSDLSPVSWLSSALLLATALLMFRLAVDHTLPTALTSFGILALVYLAFDEQFMLHEQWKFGCFQWINVCKYHLVTELPTIMVATFGLLYALLLHRHVTHELARAQLWLSILVGLFALGIDLLDGPQFLLPYEEALEVIAETLFCGVCLGIRKFTP